MTPASESFVAGLPQPTPIEPALDALLARLETQAAAPGFLAQRDLALKRALQPYYKMDERLGVTPLPDEIKLANLYLYADVFPEDGQLSLIEQVRDTIDTHVPEEERAWLDPLRHSYMDLLEIVSVSPSGNMLALRSLGDVREFVVRTGGALVEGRQGNVLLTRLIRLSDRIVLPGAALMLSAARARKIFEAAQDWRREMEVSSGSFALGEWQEFVKRYGYLLLWQVAQMRLEELVAEEAGTRFQTKAGEPFLYALALYEHHDPRFLAEGLGTQEAFQRDDTDLTQWVQREHGAVVARLTVTPIRVLVECDGPLLLDDIKHRLAAAFGFLLHFRGEATAPPAHEWVFQDVDLSKDETRSRSLVVPVEEERRLLNAFLDSMYMEWADQASPTLSGQTPRHAVKLGEGGKVGALIDELERGDLGRRRTGQTAYDYNRLRAHVGLPEVRT